MGGRQRGLALHTTLDSTLRPAAIEKANLLDNRVNIHGKGKDLQKHQLVSDMGLEVLARQAEARAERTGAMSLMDELRLGGVLGSSAKVGSQEPMLVAP